MPAIRVYPKGTAVPAHERLAALGYREKERVGAGDSMADAAEPQLESTDEFLARVQVPSAQSPRECFLLPRRKPCSKLQCVLLQCDLAQPVWCPLQALLTSPPQLPLAQHVQVAFMHLRHPYLAGHLRQLYALCHLSCSMLKCRSPAANFGGLDTSCIAGAHMVVCRMRCQLNSM